MPAWTVPIRVIGPVRTIRGSDRCPANTTRRIRNVPMDGGCPGKQHEGESRPIADRADGHNPNEPSYPGQSDKTVSIR